MHKPALHDCVHCLEWACRGRENHPRRTPSQRSRRDKAFRLENTCGRFFNDQRQNAVSMGSWCSLDLAGSRPRRTLPPSRCQCAEKGRVSVVIHKHVAPVGPWHRQRELGAPPIFRQRLSSLKRHNGTRCRSVIQRSEWVTGRTL